MWMISVLATVCLCDSIQASSSDDLQGKKSALALSRLSWHTFELASDEKKGGCPTYPPRKPLHLSNEKNGTTPALKRSPSKENRGKVAHYGNKSKPEQPGSVILSRSQTLFNGTFPLYHIGHLDNLLTLNIVLTDDTQK